MWNTPESPKKTYSLGLAPMEGVTDFPTRSWFQLIGGMDFTWTPFLRVTDTFPGKSLNPLFIPEISILQGLFPAQTKFQVMGSRPDDIIRTNDVVGNLTDVIDLNCGCPSPTVVGSCAGSSLLESADRFGSFIEKVLQGVGPERLSVKMRTGFKEASEFTGLLAALQSAHQRVPLAHLTVHGRTRPARYLGTADWSLIELACQSMSCPVIGSGDIVDSESLSDKLLKTGVMKLGIIGRGALRNPWIFRGKRDAPVGPALLSFIIMQEFFLREPMGLIRWVGDNFLRFYRADGDPDWHAVTESLVRCLGFTGEAVEDFQVSSRALSRGKMMWNYMRSSLPDVFLDGTIMRMNSLSAFYTGLKDLGRESNLMFDQFPLVYRSDRDWMYSGAGRGTGASQKLSSSS